MNLTKMIIRMFLHCVSDLAWLCQLSTNDLLEKVLGDALKSISTGDCLQRAVGGDQYAERDIRCDRGRCGNSGVLYLLSPGQIRTKSGPGGQGKRGRGSIASCGGHARSSW